MKIKRKTYPHPFSLYNPMMKNHYIYSQSLLFFSGAHVVQSLAKKLGSLLGDGPNYGAGKECDCVLLMLAHLYNYRVGKLYFFNS